MSKIKTKNNPRIETKDINGSPTGYLIPIINIHEKFINDEQWPEQVYLTVVLPGKIKGPHLHYIRNGFFTCIKGNVRIVLKENDSYIEHFSGEDYLHKSIFVPAGIPAAVQNIGELDAFVLNMPHPSWTPEMNDEHIADFSDFDF